VPRTLPGRLLIDDLVIPSQFAPATWDVSCQLLQWFHPSSRSLAGALASVQGRCQNVAPSHVHADSIPSFVLRYPSQTQSNGVWTCHLGGFAIDSPDELVCCDVMRHAAKCGGGIMAGDWTPPATVLHSFEKTCVHKPWILQPHVVHAGAIRRCWMQCATARATCVPAYTRSSDGQWERDGSEADETASHTYPAIVRPVGRVGTQVETPCSI
jgi:hypothetical protein